ncbi:MAG: translation initiation factor IF-2 [Patescibacteria group bacterium]|nr:translation initiation factor IF-2 [Patescibacteria group bacterium]
MKISDIAKKLGVSIKEVRDKAKELDFSIAQKSNTMSDKKAKEFIELVQKGMTLNTESVIKPEEEIKETILEEKSILIPDVISVKEFSEKLELPITRVMTELIKNGVMASLNENIDFETAEIVGEYLGFKIKREEKVVSKNSKVENRTIGKKKKIRPPVITIIGHVDHGKTKLLDYIRKTNVIEGESGGITQRIGAYQIERKKRKITFIDTPGHAAFSAMREHGVRITDVAVLVVAADDGVKPQTKESVNFAKEAGVPIVVAINKIDKPDANIEKTKRELADIGLVPEEWGGSTVMGSVSAKTGQGVDELLDLILLVADMKKLESYTDVPANGFVIEAKLDPGRGPVATILVRDGILKIGDAVTIGRGVWGKIKSMNDYKKKRIKEAYPSDPVRISGLSAVPKFGDLMEVCESNVEAKAKIEKYRKESSFKKIQQNVFSLTNAAEAVRSGNLRELNLIIKSDFMGSLKAIRDSLENMKFEEVSLKIINDGVGDINDSDIKMAQATDAIILGFRVEISSNAKRLLENTKVAVETFDIIYELIDKVVLTLSGLLEPEEEEIEIGKGQVLKIFKDSARDKILGVRVNVGKFEKDAIIRIYRNEDFIAEGKAVNLKEGDKTINEAEKGKEFGLNVVFKTETEGAKIKIEESDRVVAFKKQQKKKELTRIE